MARGWRARGAGQRARTAFGLRARDPLRDATRRAKGNQVEFRTEVAGAAAAEVVRGVATLTVAPGEQMVMPHVRIVDGARMPVRLRVRGARMNGRAPLRARGAAVWWSANGRRDPRASERAEAPRAVTREPPRPLEQWEHKTDQLLPRRSSNGKVSQRARSESMRSSGSRGMWRLSRAWYLQCAPWRATSRLLRSRLRPCQPSPRHLRFGSWSSHSNTAPTDRTPNLLSATAGGSARARARSNNRRRSRGGGEWLNRMGYRCLADDRRAAGQMPPTLE